MSLLAIDIGNTSAHLGLWTGQTFTLTTSVPSGELTTALPQLLDTHAVQGIAFCSVVPSVTDALITLLNTVNLPVLHLRHDQCPGLNIGYPKPQEIGQDRLANAIGAQAISGAPAVVIDMGTATTFDIVTEPEGYIGGIIAPGIALMARYLHEQTALLPALDTQQLIDFEPVRYVGTSTLEAMQLGCTVGFTGMIQALLDKVLQELQSSASAKSPAILLTGGSAGQLLRELKPHWRYEPQLTLKGLVVAFERVNTP